MIKRAHPHKRTFTHTHAASQYTMRPVRSSVLCRLLPAPFSLALRSLVLVLLCITRKSCSHEHSHVHTHRKTSRLNETCSIDSRGKLSCHYAPNKSGKQVHNVHTLESNYSQDVAIYAQASCSVS